MRNYVQQFWAKFDYDVDVNPPNPMVHKTTYDTAGSQEVLVEQAAAIQAQITANPQVQNFVTTFKGPFYFLMDKANLNLMLSGVGFAAAQTFDHFGFWPSYVYSGPNDNPRNGWTDDDGVKRDAPPSDKSSGKPRAPKTVSAETLLQSLENFAGILVSHGYKTGTNSLLDQLVVFIVALTRNKSIDMKALELLLNQIDSAIRRFG